MYYELGVLAFVMVVFVGIWGFGLRDKFSTESTASAYSVFNKDGRPIVGGFTASQFENQLRGPIATKMRDADNDPLKGPIAVLRSNYSSISRGEKKMCTLSDSERTARRNAAAEAAERRFNCNKEE